MKFIMHRDRVITGFGHAIEFKKGEPTYVPPELRREVVEKGGEPADGSELPDDQVKKGPAEPDDPTERAEQLRTAIESLVEGGVREDFTAAGAPHTKSLTALLGWQPTAQERDEAWLAYQADKGE